MNLMKLHIQDEFSPLKSVAVVWNTSVPEYSTYATDDPEFTKFHPFSWDVQQMREQQNAFFRTLEKYGVQLVFPDTAPNLLWQMYTRDVAFVVGERLFYSDVRKMVARNGEIEKLLDALQLPAENRVPLQGDIEGGDILVVGENTVYAGNSSRTSRAALEQLSTHVDVRVFELGEHVMHLDTRLTILPNQIALVERSAFKPDDVAFLASKYDVIPVTPQEAKRLGTNVFVINPTTICVPTEHERIAKLLEEKGFVVELLDYDEPINLGGSFRCTTLPLERE